ncbi:predicted protein [Sclerotinia sclerotiorum 1980 UF-70]|uniref:Homologous-pairing protein 2 winged helix domain-containing protein n=2 Tax=Sclerotinia sclerotiorum (strain ATCC 18683 / 1980 / Ss-1) TaxID=665079 RepID=A7ERG3_SCLS1|nr:predicted protein [Sclerotinia sclerotiorum 1980 UF-70]APA13463.1 hypothetical protein sscle_11g082330 [Sclerotinia sclerotiorum 1980 UF-70]EDN92055.1 predicted protein [Sclerotinia sclerotiorum 1980 UF-70]
MPPKRKKSLLDPPTESSIPDDNFDVSSIASLPSTASATPIKPKSKKPKVEKTEKSEKVKATSKAKTSVKEKVLAKDKEGKESKGKVGAKDGKEVKDTKEIKETKEAKLIGKDGKEKVKAVTGDEAQEVLMEYLIRENRPFSAGDVSGNLHGKVTKTLTDKLLKELSNSGLINGKGTNGDGKGSQWVYWALQSPSTLSPEELAAMDTEIENLRARIPELRMDVKKLNIKLGGLEKELGIGELKERIERLEEGKREKEERLRGLREGGVKVVKKEEVERVARELSYWGRMRGIRKRGFLNAEGVLLEGMGREEIWERAGIEGDEEEG